jgi:hypothetical protein
LLKEEEDYKIANSNAQEDHADGESVAAGPVQRDSAKRRLLAKRLRELRQARRNSELPVPTTPSQPVGADNEGGGNQSSIPSELLEQKHVVAKDADANSLEISEKAIANPPEYEHKESDSEHSDGSESQSSGEDSEPELEEGESEYKAKSDRHVILLECEEDGKKYLAIRQREGSPKLHLLCRGRKASNYFPLWFKKGCVDKAQRHAPGADWGPYTVEVGAQWLLLETLPPGTLKEWKVEPWLDARVMDGNHMKPPAKRRVSILRISDNLLQQAESFLDALRHPSGFSMKRYADQIDKSAKVTVESKRNRVSGKKPTVELRDRGHGDES